MTTKFCTNCGAEMDADKRFCTTCGSQFADEAAPNTVSQTQPPAPPVSNTPTAQPMQPTAPPPDKKQAKKAAADPDSGGKYEAISTGGYIGIILLMCIPLLGQILTIIWACGGCRKVNKRNLARAMLVFWLIAIVLGVIVYFTGHAFVSNYLGEGGLSGLLEQYGGLGNLDGLGEMLTQLQELQNLQLPTTTTP